MTLPTGNKPARAAEIARRRAFTLVELIVVMTLLTIVISIAAPQLGSFFRGRTLDHEARRLLALTHYAQNRAVAEGVPMILWIDPKQRTYGLTMEAGYADTDDKAAQHTIAENLEIDVQLSAIGASQALVAGTGQFPATARTIRFSPEGFLSADAPEAIVLREGEREELLLAPARNRLNYEIQTASTQLANR